ncbi:MAG: MBOAT family protein, partial [Gemmatimonadota bacterium]
VWAIFVTFHLVLVTWVFFRADSLSAATSIYSRIWGSFGTLPGLLRTRVTTPEILYSVGLIVALMILEVFEEKAPLWKQLEEKPRVIRWAAYYAMILALVVLGSWGQQEFVYMQF